MSYLMHVTIDTGHGRRSYRDEVNDAVVTLLRQQIAEMLAGMPVETHPGYTLTGTSAGAALLATVTGRVGALATVAVAANGKVSMRLWEELRNPPPGMTPAVGDPPQAPWCAVRLYPALKLDPEAAAWLGDFERCLAWAWIEGGKNG